MSNQDRQNGFLLEIVIGITGAIFILMTSFIINKQDSLGGELNSSSFRIIEIKGLPNDFEFAKNGNEVEFFSEFIEPNVVHATVMLKEDQFITVKPRKNSKSKISIDYYNSKSLDFNGHLKNDSIVLYKDSLSYKGVVVNENSEFFEKSNPLTDELVVTDTIFIKINNDDKDALYTMAISISNDIALIGNSKYKKSEKEVGIVHVFRKNEFLKWEEIGTIRNDTVSNFGAFLGLNKDTAFIYGEGTSDFEDQEIIFVYKNMGSGKWIHEQTIFPANHFDYFDTSSISLFEDIALIGCANCFIKDFISTGISNLYDEGVVLVYEKNKGKWKQKDVLIPPKISNGFGKSISVYKDRAIIGDSYKPMLYEYEKIGTNSWSLKDSIDPLNHNLEVKNFGISLSLFDRVLLVGDDYLENSNTNDYESYDGLVYIYYEDNDNNWKVIDVLEGDLSNGVFGSNISYSKNDVLIDAGCDEECKKRIIYSYSYSKK